VVVRDLIDVLELSVKKHGPDKVLTLGHLLNLLKLAEREAYKEKQRHHDILDYYDSRFD
jgi:hypothetical protein